LQAQDAGYGYIFPGPYAVAFDFPSRGNAAEDVTHPDLLFVGRAREEVIALRFVEGVPDLVIEVLSPSNQRRDLVEKRRIHERNGVPYYWIVDPRGRTIAQYTLVGEPYLAGSYGPLVTLGVDDVLTCPLFPDIAV